MPRRPTRRRTRYRARPPIMHAASRVHPRAENAGPELFTELDTNDGVTPAFTVPHNIAVPNSTMWIREVTHVEPNARSMCDFAGRYVEAGDGLADGLVRVCAGDVLLVCTRRGDVGDEHINIYIDMLTCWFSVDLPAIHRVTGWHMLIRSYLREWVVLTRTQRVVRACTERIAQCSAARDQLPEPREQDRSMLLRQIRGLIAVRESAIAEHRGSSITYTDLTCDALVRSFGAWAQTVAEHTNCTTETVIQALSDTLSLNISEQGTTEEFLTIPVRATELDTENRQTRNVVTNRRRKDG